MKNVLIILTGMILLCSLSVTAQEQPDITAPDTATVANPELAAQPPADQIVVYYLHMNRRCMTCEKLEAYSKEAIESGFADQLQDSTLLFKVENFEEEGKEHYAKDYQLFSQSVILSRLHEGKETEWKALDKIWELVGDKEEFIAYVQAEVSSFANPKEAK